MILMTIVRITLITMEARMGKMQVNPPISIFKVPGMFLIGRNLLNSQIMNPKTTKPVPK